MVCPSSPAGPEPPQARLDTSVNVFLVNFQRAATVQTRVRYGARRIHILLRREGWKINHKRVHRLYVLAGLNLRSKRPRRRKAAADRLLVPQDGTLFPRIRLYFLPTPYLWIVLELAYLLRLRGIEANTPANAHGDEEGVRTNRRKGSRDNLVLWSPRLRASWDAAVALRDRLVSERARPIPMRASLEFGHPLLDANLTALCQRQ